MNEYVPHKWVVIKIPLPDQITYKVFGCWYGGLGSSDSWKLNSGITKVKEDEDFWIFEGYSGSSYACYKNSYGTNLYGQGVLNNIIKNAKEEGVEIEILKEETDWSKIDYAM